MFKKMLSSLLVSAIFVSGSAAAYASPEESAKVPITQTKSISKDLYTVDGDFLGNLNKTTTIEQVTDENGKASYTSTVTKDYELAEEYAAIPAYTEKFADSTEITTFSVNEENELEVNGEVISENDFPTVSFSRPGLGGNSFALNSNDSGGEPTISHYYSNSDRTRYTFGTYSGVSFKFDHGVYVGPTGNNVSRTNIPKTNSNFYDAKAAMDSAETNYRDTYVKASAFAFAAALAFFSMGSVITFIPGGGAAGFAAVDLYNVYSDLQDDVGDAYAAVSHM
ncbi:MULTISPECIES: hypothetical protein [Paenibacillus]|uniref:hypothetical protein n=1 Tax=Paenibacillus TaxID=44249 RepID=UPI00040A6D96|nr:MULTISPECIES: hypothetical protein [Paenibacillus]KGP77669.1 hypothetical protein P363_0133055 [Paenibacillus sp. MAEPY1]KGP83789.1 hypothetical protein P364_0107055 [Paenibacillus sp. MAEPY2]OZQ58871.1 hypothetical protein CA599_31490 [Paenibacillus taichungensis]HBU85167.1 hypothetical protein [Paenibacillus sp.]